MADNNVNVTPTDEIYRQLEQAYKHFNEQLFDNQLPSCLLTVQREKATMGYFSPNRWSNTKGTTAHEIAINPAYFAGFPLIEVFQTLVHEQVHLWQEEFGSPSRACYHNREWADKMESIGLMPSSTGYPGGKRVGQSMNDYPAPHGQFIQACTSLVESGFFLSWIDRRVAVELATPFFSTLSISESPNTAVVDQASDGIDVEEFDPVDTDTNAILQKPVTQRITGFVSLKPDGDGKYRIKYQCPQCNAAVWGKPKLLILCVKCDVNFDVSLKEKS